MAAAFCAGCAEFDTDHLISMELLHPWSPETYELRVRPNGKVELVDHVSHFEWSAKADITDTGYGRLIELDDFLETAPTPHWAHDTNVHAWGLQLTFRVDGETHTVSTKYGDDADPYAAAWRYHRALAGPMFRCEDGPMAGIRHGCEAHPTTTLQGL